MRRSCPRWLCPGVRFREIRNLVSPTMPFANLPDTHKSRCGDELTAEKMRECVWLRPEAVAQVEFFRVDGRRSA